jgi:hypothetical protein
LEEGKKPDPSQPFPEKMKVGALRLELGVLNVPTKGVLKPALIEALRAARPQGYPINFITKNQGMLEGVKELANLSDPKAALALIHPQR